MLVVSPWIFGTTQPPVIAAMNWCGAVLWGLLGIKWALRAILGYRPARWEHLSHPGLRKLLLSLGLLTGMVLSYILISAWNARATWQPQTQSFIYHSCLNWLPHSYHQEGTWQVLANFSALAGFFWSLWDWLSGLTETEERAARRQFLTAPGPTEATPFPARLQLLLWVICMNGGLLALEGIVQRLSGTNKLLWLVEPRVNKDAMTHFGPYAYRANGAQFLNLLWPVALGFWWTLQRSRGFRNWRHHVLLAAGALMAAGPFVSTARGGALVAGGMLAASLLFLASMAWIYPQRRSTAPRAQFATAAMLCAFFAVALLLARNLGWENLSERMTQIDSGMENREEIYDTARTIARDYQWWGTGPGSLIALYPLYRGGTDEYWPAQLHNDWLETRVTFGRVGFGLILLAFGLVLGRWWMGGGIPGGRRFVGLIWLALLGCLIHARFDFPFQIYSLQMVVLTLCAVLLTLSKRSRE